MARVSVIMAVYNAARYLHESVGSILSQTYRDFELVIVDDASSDGSAEILKTFDDPRVRVITHETNKGAAASRNAATMRRFPRSANSAGRDGGDRAVRSVRLPECCRG